MRSEVTIVVSQTNQENPNIAELLLLVERLPLDDRLDLLQKLLRPAPGLSLVVGNQQLSGNIVVQINTMDKDQLGDLLKVVAERIAKEGV